MRRILPVTASLFLTLAGCATLPNPSNETDAAPQNALTLKNGSPEYCQSAWNGLSVYNVSQDGKDIGREVRSTHFNNGPLGPERIVLSHLVRRYGNETIELDRSTILSQRILSTTNSLLYSSFVTIDESSVQLSLVGFNGADWDRVDTELESVRDPLLMAPTDLQIPENTLIGFELNERLRDVARGTAMGEKNVSFYISRLQTPLALDIEKREPATAIIAGTTVPGSRVVAFRAGTDRVWLSVFVGHDGRILEETYPPLHQIRTLAGRFPTQPSEYADPYVGLYSQTYLALPDITTHNEYEIVSEQPIALKDLSFIDEPENQVLSRVNERTLKLSVTSGAPDGTRPPESSDLDSNEYIDSKNTIIINALTYLKTGGAEGSLPTHRRENAVAVVAGVSQITGNRAFWKNPGDVAKLIMNYVHAILPDKQHTHTMKSASSALIDGLGDCTEHSVLFAALMRAAGIPTRLVSGIYLARGGAWVYHMWNEYFDGTSWQSIDSAVGPFYRTGAHYIALGRGVSDFADHRNKIAFFLDTAFSGLAINLVSAVADGQSLNLAKPSRQHFAFSDATIFNATTAIRRGDMKRALEVVDAHYRSDVAPIRLQILRADLIFQNKRHDDALEMIREIRTRTSLPANVQFLDILEMKILFEVGRIDTAEVLLSRICGQSDTIESTCVVFRGDLLIARREFKNAATLLETALPATTDDISLMIAFVSLIAQPDVEFSEDQIALARKTAEKALFQTHYADAEVLKAATHLYFKLGDMQTAIPYLLHSLEMLPFDQSLTALEYRVENECR